MTFSKKMQAPNQISQYGNHDATINLQPLINQVIPQPLHNHVTLSSSQRFIIYSKNQGLASFLHSDATSALQDEQQNNKQRMQEQEYIFDQSKDMNKSRNFSSKYATYLKCCQTVHKWMLYEMWNLAVIHPLKSASLFHISNSFTSHKDFILQLSHYNLKFASFIRNPICEKNWGLK